MGRKREPINRSGFDFGTYGEGVSTPISHRAVYYTLLTKVKQSKGVKYKRLDKC